MENIYAEARARNLDGDLAASALNQYRISREKRGKKASHTKVTEVMSRFTDRGTAYDLASLAQDFHGN